MVFPTRVGVDQITTAQPPPAKSFPHTRGGGPVGKSSFTSQIRFSPHAWGWTATLSTGHLGQLVFPTRVGVDLGISGDCIQYPSFPHTRGGGPMCSMKVYFCPTFSPHAWGWTYRAARISERGCVFPTRVGVDLYKFLKEHSDWSFPHTRGGGPVEIAAALNVTKFSPHAWGWT